MIFILNPAQDGVTGRVLRHGPTQSNQGRAGLRARADWKSEIGHSLGLDPQGAKASQEKRQNHSERIAEFEAHTLSRTAAVVPGSQPGGTR
jgi:hypothetical protein